MPLTDAQRRARGYRRVVVWLDPEHARRLREIEEHSGHDVTTIVRGYIDQEWAEIEALCGRSG